MATCANCEQKIPKSDCRCSYENWEFCTTCSGIATALGIGDPTTSDVWLYESGSNAINWMGEILGAVVHKSCPPRLTFGPNRFRVRMLDGSMWHGYGPTRSGTYISLRRMKG